MGQFAITEFKHLTTIDGLNNGTINSISQDTLGKLWLATWDGLMSYDGYRIRNYKPVTGDTNSLPAKQCRYLYTDSNGNLWVGTRMGICRYDPVLDCFVNYFLEGFNERFTNETRIFECSGFMFLYFNDGQLYALPLEKINRERVFRKVNLRHRDQREFSLNFNYASAVNNQVFIIRYVTGENGHISSEIYSSRILEGEACVLELADEYFVDAKVSSVLPDGDNRVYIATDQGLYFLSRIEKNIEKVNSPGSINLRELLISSDRKLWMGTHQSGLGCLDLHTGQFKMYRYDPNSNNSLLGNSIFALFEDFAGSLWIGHGGEGLSQVNLQQKPFDTFHHDPADSYSLKDNTVFCFNESNQEVLLGTYYGGLNLMSYDTGLHRIVFDHVAFPDYFHKTENYYSVWCISRESNNLFWLGTNEGLIKAMRKSNGWSFQQYLSDLPSPIRHIFIDRNHNLWIGSYEGLYLIPFPMREGMNYYHYTNDPEDPGSLSDMVVTSMLVDKTGKFWMGTQNGGLNLLRGNYHDLDLSGKECPDLQFIRYNPSGKNSSGLNNSEINCLYEHPGGSIWIGTQGGGINIFDPVTNLFSYLTVADGLPGEDVFGILPDEEGQLWMSTNKGLSCYNILNRSFTNYSPSDGIQGNVFMVNSFYRSPTGKLYFGGRHGFTCFEPELMKKNEIPPKVHFSGLEILNKSVKIGDTLNGRVLLNKNLSFQDGIVLDFKDNNFSILFSAVHSQSPSENMVEYLLDDGYSENWTRMPAKAGIINFSSLQDGLYTLKIRAGNSDNVWTHNNMELGIRILPPWWKTILAKIIFSFLIVMAISGLMLLIIHRQSLAHSLKIEKIEKQKISELNESKLQFFTNISHELRTPLSLILAPIEDLLRKQELLGYQVSRQLTLAYRNAKQLYRLVNQIIDFRRLNAGKLTLVFSEGDFSEFIRHTVQNFDYIRSKREINLVMDLPKHPFPLWFDPYMMEQVMYNLLSNAFKFTKQAGIISLSLDYSDGLAKLEIFNDGSNIPEDKLERIFERFYKLHNSYEGSGIGLSFSKSLVELHHGSISARSDKNGVTFVILLPAGDEHLNDGEKTSGQYYESFALLPASDPEKPADGDEVELETEYHPLSVLVVDDNEELRGFFRTILSDKYNFQEAENGLKGYEMAQKLIPDIIISDVIMPEMNGYQLCRNVKNNINTCHIPVILLTAKDSQESEIDGFASGADAYIVKPFEIRVLEAQIDRLMKNRQLIHEKYRHQGYNVQVSAENLSKDDHFIMKIRDLVEQHISDQDFNVNTLSEFLFLSPTQVYRKVLALTGSSAVKFIKTIRLMKASELLRTNKYSVKEVCFRTGFSNPSYFVKCFKKEFKSTPSEYSSSK